MPRLDGVDISHYQGSTFPWPWVADQGCRLGACKMTEGVSGVDWTGPHNRAEIARVGLRWRGMYHYCRAGDPKGNAHHFQDAVGALDDHEFVFPDLESGMTDEVGAVVTMLEAFEEIYPGRVADYQGKYFAHGDSAAYDRWPWILPAYPWPNQIIPQTTRPVVMWQYAGGAHGVTVPGTRDFGGGPLPIGNVDSNQVIDVVTMDRLCGLTSIPIPPGPPPPHEEQSLAYFRDDRASDWQIWVVATDAIGNAWSCPISDLPDHGKWELVQPILGDPPVKPFGALIGLMDAQNRPTPFPALPPPSNDIVKEHSHLGGVTGPTGGVIR